MKAKLLLWMFVIIVMSAIGQATYVIQENLSYGDDSAENFYTTNWRAQTFRPTTNHTPTLAGIKYYIRGTYAGPVYINITNTTVAGAPQTGVGYSLCGGTNSTSITTDTAGAWYNITLSGCPTLYANTNYTLLSYTPTGSGSHDVVWRLDQTAPPYNRGSFWISSNSGGTWTETSTKDFMFEIYSNTSTVSNFTITAIDEFNGTAINTFSAYVDSTWYHTTTGTITTSLLSNDTSYHNITFNTTDYFNRTYSNYNISVSGNLIGSLHQAELCLNSTEKISNNAVSSITYYIGSVSGTSCFNVTAATHSVVATKSGWFNTTQNFTLTALEQENNTIENMSYANFTIYAREANGGAYISSYDLNISSLNYTTWIGENITGVTNYSWYLINGTYTVTISKSGYATTNATANISVGSHTNYTFYLYEENTLNISVYDEQTNTLINSTTVNIDIIQTNQTSNYTTANGTLYVTGLVPGEIEIRYADTTNYYRGRIYILTLSNSTYQEVRLYLLNLTLGSLITLDMVDQDGQDVEGGIIKAQRFYPSENLYRTVAMTRTNFNGQGSIDMVKKSTQSNVFYKFIVEIDGVVKEETDPLEINPLTTDVLYFTINVLEDIFVSWDGANTGVVSGDLTFNATGNQFSFVWNDPTNLIREGCLKVRRVTPLTEIEICNNCTVSASATLLCNVTNTGDLYRAEGLIDTDTNNSLYTVAVLDYSYDDKSSTFGLFGVFLAVLFIGTFAMIGLWNPIVAVVLATVATVFAAILGMVHMTYVTVITIVILAGIIIAKSRT